MKRKLFWWVLSFVIGIYASALFNLETVLCFSFVFLILLVILLYIKPAFVDVGLILCGACVLAGAFLFYYENSGTHSFLSEFAGKMSEINIRVSDFPQKGKKYYTVYGKAESVKTDEGTYYFNENCMARLYDKECSLMPGDIIKVKAKVLLPSTSEKISEDYSLYLKTKRIYTILSVKTGHCEFVSESKRNFSETLFVIRRNLSERIYKYLPDDEASLLSAMLLGDRALVKQEISDNFSKSGISHIIAVSGLHVNTICAMLYAFSSLLNVNKRNIYPFAIMLILMYVPFTGMSVSAVRAGIVAILFIISILILRRADPLTSLAFSALIILLKNPLNAFSVSFMLSYGATLGILLFCGKISNFLCRFFHISKKRAVKNIIFSALSVTLSAQIFTVPIVINYFGIFTVWSFITNLFIPSMLLPLFTGGTFLILSDLIFAPLTGLSLLFTYPILKTIIKISERFASFEKGIINLRMDAKSVFLYAVLMTLVYSFLCIDEKMQNKAMRNR